MITFIILQFFLIGWICVLFRSRTFKNVLFSLTVIVILSTISYSSVIWKPFTVVLPYGVDGVIVIKTVVMQDPVRGFVPSNFDLQRYLEDGLFYSRNLSDFNNRVRKIAPFASFVYIDTEVGFGISSDTKDDKSNRQKNKPESPQETPFKIPKNPL